MEYVLVTAGLGLLVLAGDALVRGAVAVALKARMSPLVIGATIVAIGTSAPELVVGIDAVRSGAPTLALGNVVGSNIANILLAVGLPAIILPIATATQGTTRTTIVMIGATAVVIATATLGPYGWLAGLSFLALLGLFIFDTIRAARKAHASGLIDTDALAEDVDLSDAEGMSYFAASAFLLGGLAGVILGADLLVRGAVTIAQNFGVSEAVIGLTLVAIGTSLPELATALIAAFKGQGDVAVGNVIGSNVFNLLGITGASALFGPIPIPSTFWAFDFWVMAGAAVALLPFCLTRRPVGRIAGAVMLACYVAYIWQTAHGSVATGGPILEAQRLPPLGQEAI